MVDRPIIFSGAMVRALIAGRKTQTRRLATSPLRRVEIGDRLYVREAWRVDGRLEKTAPRDMSVGESVMFEADGTVASACGMTEVGRLRPGMHMPRWASRLKLIVEGVKVEPLLPISDADARAEGLVAYRAEELPGYHVDAWHWLSDVDDRAEMFGSASSAYAALWNDLHTTKGERWQDNPAVVVLTFRIERGNIDTDLILPP